MTACGADQERDEDQNQQPSAVSPLVQEVAALTRDRIRGIQPGELTPDESSAVDELISAILSVLRASDSDFSPS